MRARSLAVPVAIGTDACAGVPRPPGAHGVERGGLRGVVPDGEGEHARHVEAVEVDAREGARRGAGIVRQVQRELERRAGRDLAGRDPMRRERRRRCVVGEIQIDAQMGRLRVAHRAGRADADRRQAARPSVAEAQRAVGAIDHERRRRDRGRRRRAPSAAAA